MMPYTGLKLNPVVSKTQINEKNVCIDDGRWLLAVLQLRHRKLHLVSKLAYSRTHLLRKMKAAMNGHV